MVALWPDAWQHHTAVIELLRKEGMLCEVTVNDMFVLDRSDVRSSAGLWNVSVVLMLRVCCFGSPGVHLATCHGSRAQSCARASDKQLYQLFPMIL